MRSQILGSLAALVALNTGGMSTATRLATPITPTPIRECKVTVSGDSVPIRAEPIIVNAQYTAAIGDSISAAFADSSKISVERVTPTPGTPQSAQLTLGTSKAAPGVWGMTLKGTTGECVGKIKVAAGPIPVPTPAGAVKKPY
jgi:hypothetical protein